MLKKILGLMVVLIVVTSCSVSFEVDAPEQANATSVDIPNTAGAYVEKAIQIPEDARKSGITITEVTVFYTVSKSDNTMAGQLKLYASSDTNADQVKGSSDELLIDKTVGITDSSVSGSVVSEKIKEALNNKQSSFVIGVENLSAGVSLNLTVYTHIKGTVNPFEL